VGTQKIQEKGRVCGNRLNNSLGRKCHASIYLYFFMSCPPMMPYSPYMVPPQQWPQQSRRSQTKTVDVDLANDVDNCATDKMYYPMMYPPQMMHTHPTFVYGNTAIPPPMHYHPTPSYPSSGYDDPFAPPHDAPLHYREEDEKISQLRQEIQDLKNTLVQHQEETANDGHCDWEPPRQPPNITCIYHNATEETPKEKYILRLPRDKRYGAYVFPKD
jgi:hypothetical protein